MLRYIINHITIIIIFNYTLKRKNHLYKSSLFKLNFVFTSKNQNLLVSNLYTNNTHLKIRSLKYFHFLIIPPHPLPITPVSLFPLFSRQTVYLSLPMSFTVFPHASIPFPIRPCKFPIPVFFVVIEMPLVRPSVEPFKFTFPFHFLVIKLTIILILITPCIFTISMYLII